jgi:dihydropteroate synthase
VSLVFASRSLPLGGPPHAMGIVNVTADSFYDRGATADPRDAVARGLELWNSGAAIVDVGGMTAQPGPVLSEDAEASRVVPVIAGLRQRGDGVISVDTYRASVAAAALDAGADLVNDHTGLSDPGMAAAVAARDAGLVVTHLRLPPKHEQDGRYSIAVEDVVAFLAGRARLAMEAGVRPAALLLDPGLGFGKDTSSDLDTLRRLPELGRIGFPLLLACSHKEVTAEPLGLPESSLEGTAAVVAVAAYMGVAVLRLHDLPFMTRVARMGWLLRPDGPTGDCQEPDPGPGPGLGGSSGWAKKPGRKRPSR